MHLRAVHSMGASRFKTERQLRVSSQAGLHSDDGHDSGFPDKIALIR